LKEDPPQTWEIGTVILMPLLKTNAYLDESGVLLVDLCWKKGRVNKRRGRFERQERASS
jgi:hypothetical protein